MAGFFYKGILLQQRKEPALSRDLHEFINADTMGLHMDCPPVADPDALSYGDIIQFARKAKIVDERDGESLASKLLMARKQNIRAVIVDAVDDEPYISSQLNPLMKNLELAERGLDFCQRACGAQQAYFTVYKNLTDLDVRIPRYIGAFTVMRLHGRYPAEYQASQKYTDQEDVLVIGSGAVIHLARAILLRKPQTTAFITVAGDCVGASVNLEVSLGMTATQVLERCGLIDDPHRVIVGGSMTGISVMDTDKTIVTPTTRAILAFRQNIKTLGLSCVGCARCVHVCPEGLNPYYLYKSFTQNRFDVFHKLDAQMCVGCGTCSYMCPAKLDLSATIFQGASGARGHVRAMHRTGYLDRKRDKADYQRFMDDYLLGKQISSHRIIRWKAAYKLSTTCREAMFAYQKSRREGKKAMRKAQQEFRQAVYLADAGLAVAKQTMEHVHTQLQRTEKAEETALAKVVQMVQTQLKDARLAGNIAEVAARQNVLAVIREQRRFADEVAKAAQTKAKFLEAKASPQEIIEIQQERDRLIQQAEQRRADACARAQNSAVRAVDHARAAFEQAVAHCHEKLDSQKKIYAQAQQAIQERRETSAQQYALAQTLCEQEKMKAQAHLADVRMGILKQIEMDALTLSKVIATNAPEVLEHLREADIALEAARERALASALASAQADADVTGRAIHAQDFRPPIRLRKCERERLLGHNLLALGTAVLQKQQIADSAHGILLSWVRAHGLQDQAAAQDHSSEEVLV